MLIELLTGIVGLRGSHDPGDVVELPDTEAMALIRSGQAVARNERPIESASIRTQPAQGRQEYGRIQNAKRR